MKYTPPVPAARKSVDDHDPAVLGVDPSFKSKIRFVDVTEDSMISKPPFVMSMYGGEGAGKSRFIGTAPGDIGVLALEYKSLPSIIPAARENGKRVILPVDNDGKPINLVRNSRASIIAQQPAQCITPDDFKKYDKLEDQVKAASRAMQEKTRKIRYTDPVPECCQQHMYRWHFSREKACGMMLAELDNVKTIAIDTFGQFVEDCLFACYGRTDNIIPLEKKSFNQEVRDFLNCVSGKNLILTHHSSDVWVDGKPTKKTKPMTTFNKIGHYTTVMAKFQRDKKADTEAGQPMYTLFIEDCLARPDLIGDTLEDGDISFLALASKVYPDVDIDVWM